MAARYYLRYTLNCLETKETILFCRRFALALAGGRDSSALIPTELGYLMFPFLWLGTYSQRLSDPLWIALIDLILLALF
jgi:hypothetical protein